MPSMIIRPVTLSDIDALIKIGKQTYFETFFEGFNDPAGFEAYITEVFAVDRLEAELRDADSAFYFAITGRRVVGYYKINYGLAQTLFQLHGTAELEHIYVLAEFHGRYMGKALLSHAITAAQNRGMTKLWLAVWEHNQKAIDFYKKNGLLKFSTHSYFVAGDPQRDHLMGINLNIPEAGHDNCLGWQSVK